MGHKRRRDLYSGSVPLISRNTTEPKAKRHKSNADDRSPSPVPRVRPRIESGDRLSNLSDELLIRILHLLPVECVLLCQLLNKKWRRLAADSQVWKSLYYTRFVLPRAMRIPGLKDDGGPGLLPGFSSKRSKWLDEEKLLEYTASKLVGKRRTDWKARYRLRHNWSIGAADVKSIELGLGEEEEEANSPSLMVRLADGVVITADPRDGLRAWDIKGKDAGRKCLASCHLGNSDGSTFIPKSLGIDTANTLAETTGVAVGFSNGGFGIWKLTFDEAHGAGTFCQYYRRLGLANEDEGKGLSAVAYAHPYLLTISEQQVLSLYGFGFFTGSSFKAGTTPASGDLGGPHIPPATLSEGTAAIAQTVPTSQPDSSHPRLLTILRSHTTWPPLSLSIRSTPSSIIASIAYALPTYLSGWSIGLQELHLTSSGEISQSRLASAVDIGFKPLLSSPSSSSSCSPSTFSNSTDGRGRITTSRPTTLSYSHPYLLASHPDNTLSLYLVTSNASELKISKGTTLWGHTSSVAGAQIGGRGRAVSSSVRGDELRVWELEGGMGRKKMLGDRSVRIRGEGLDVDMIDGDERRGWVGFDDEVVVVMKKGNTGGQSLVVYDFT
ncbi:MAG: hypothetical protein M1818_002563 [Claussenomyces sp. TS43310]|nr:MAG: hypothetical protein M1818_002563 [Claussenomyces sp. TS43310]